MGIWSKKAIEEVIASGEGGPRKLKRTLHALDLVLFGIGVVIGAGLFSITGLAAAEHAGPAIVLSYIIASIACAFAGLCYCELASMIPVSGSAYTYTYVTMGELVAWIMGWTLVLEYAIGAATVSISWSAYFASFLNDFGIALPATWTASPWQSVRLPDGTCEYGLVNLPAALIVIIASCILIKGIRESAVVNAIIVALKVAIVLIFIALGIGYIQGANYIPFIPENTGVFGEFGWSGVLRAAGIVFFAYVGFDAVSTTTQEAVNPQKTVPIGILGSLLICTILYVLFSFVLTGVVNYRELDVAAPVAVAIDRMPYLWLHWMIKLAILCGFTSVILILLLGQSRVFYSMSRDGLLPKIFSHLHPTFRTPWICNLIFMLFTGLLGAFSPLSMVGNMTSIGTLLAFVMVCIGVLVLRYTSPALPRAFRTPWVPVILLLGIITCLALMLSLNLATWIRLIVWIAVGLLIYFGYGRFRSRKI